jgi:hypothetical protein
MKTLLSILLLFVAQFVSAADTPAPPTTPIVVTGEVLETQDASGYTYIRLKTKDGEAWAAVSKTTVKQGSKVTIENVMVMNNFESKSLKKTFNTILFGTLAGTNGQGTANAMGMAHAGMGKPVDTENIKVTKATGANAKTVAEIITQAPSLKDKPVLVRGKVVKYNSGIMGKNWVHLRDGSGSAADNTNDLLVTSMNEVKIGDVVTAKGTVRTDKDFGSGYAYKVIIEEATFHQ